MKKNNHLVLRGANSSKRLNKPSAPPSPAKPTKKVELDFGLTSAYQAPPSPPIKNK